MGRRYSLSGENLSLGTGYVMAAIQPAAAGAAGSWIEIRARRGYAKRYVDCGSS